MRKIKHFSILVGLIGVVSGVFAQATTNSPYSRYGVGNLRSESFNRNFALGGVGYGLRSVSDINFMNPASYSKIGITSVEFAFTNNALMLSDGRESQFQNNAYINHLAFAFPVINKKWGMSFGIKPFSNTGYEYDNTVTHQDTAIGDIYSVYKGDGGLNQIYFGNGVAINLDSTSSISLGVNASVLFGSLNSDKKIIYSNISNALNIWEIYQKSIVGGRFNAGLQYQKSFTNADEEVYNLTVGGVYTLQPELSTEELSLIRTFRGNVDFGQVKDTLVDTPDEKGTLELPATIGFGISFAKENKWLIAADITTTGWGDISNADTALFQYQNSYNAALGFEFVPKHDAFNNYLKRIKYRFGVKYGTGSMIINNQEITNYGITFGLGLPLKRTDTAVPGLNIGVEYGSRGVATNGLVEEKYVNINLGITINDRWFIKRKYD